MLDRMEDVAIDATSGRTYVALVEREDPDKLIDFCREVGASYRTGDGEMFVVRFPRDCAQPYTESALRASLVSFTELRP